MSYAGLLRAHYESTRARSSPSSPRSVPMLGPMFSPDPSGGEDALRQLLACASISYPLFVQSATLLGDFSF